MGRPQPYTPPVDQLLTLGDPRSGTSEGRDRIEDWRDYRALGLSERDVPELIRMSTDKSLHHGREPQYWAPVHAWRALGQMRSPHAVRPLLNLLNYFETAHDDWGFEEVPEILAMIGPPAVADSARFVETATNGLYARVAAASALELIGRRYPEQRERCIAALRRTLTKSHWNAPALNGFLISYLVDLKAETEMHVIEQAFMQGRVDVTIMGGLTRVREEMQRCRAAAPAPVA
jgi:hypothetical protein